MPITLHVDPSAIRVKHLRQFSRAKSFDDMALWLIEHAGANEAELDELTFAELLEAQKSFFEQLKDSALPKVSSGA